MPEPHSRVVEESTHANRLDRNAQSHGDQEQDKQRIGNAAEHLTVGLLQRADNHLAAAVPFCFPT